ncbi:FAS1-like dehydratase domain-containing protein [Streptomyces sp. HM190]|uniref:FAS1-like dehydratase domain-containing protein n=1 Tax=Streptomyces sp. HM190 TaxID=2695266 RepID=UPI0013592219|nr:MaoC family dehydratase N-terminal domain-containing protein [Streptomyces sp. HM190]
MTGLADALAGWSPAEVRTTDVIDPWPVAAFSALLDLPGTAAAEGEPLPPGWHWFSFLDHPRQSALGVDGHPAHGHFLPPIPDRRRMVAGGRIRIHRPMHVGDHITLAPTLHDVQVKQGRSGEMAFVTVRRSFLRGADLLVTEDQDIVYRSQPAGAPRAPEPAAPPAPAEEPQPDWSLALAPDAATLFRFSALTYNAHRIHYDVPYATGVEGYPGLVVHGPLLALLTLELPRRFAPSRPVETFAYRLRRPAFAGTGITVRGWCGTDGGEAALCAGALGADTSIRATVSFGTA